MRAVIVEAKGAEARLEEVAEEDILSGPVELDVLYSSYNYKDGLAITGAGRGVLQHWPIIPGIDIVGRVTRSDDPAWDPGDTVVLNGDGIGESRNGGFATRARVRVRGHPGHRRSRWRGLGGGVPTGRPRLPGGGIHGAGRGGG